MNKGMTGLQNVVQEVSKQYSSYKGTKEYKAARDTVIEVMAAIDESHKMYETPKYFADCVKSIYNGMLKTKN